MEMICSFLEERRLFIFELKVEGVGTIRGGLDVFVLTICIVVSVIEGRESFKRSRKTLKV